MQVVGAIRNRAILILSFAALIGLFVLVSALASSAVADDGAGTGVSASFQVGALAGDCDGDGRVCVLDVTCVERIILALSPATPGADANGDSTVNALDITTLERMILGIWSN